jgi:hypothetical protein
VKANTGNKTRTTTASNYTAVGVVFLLLLYMTGALPIESFHDLLHTHELVELHSVTHENDPCHRTIYHNETKNACEHESHIDIIDKCALCGFCFSAAHIVMILTNVESFVFPLVTFNEVSNSLPIDFSGYQSSRGPPSI